MTRRLVILAILIATMSVAWAGGDGEARRVFEKAYNQVFNSEGCTLHYNVSLAAFYKTEGTIWYKKEKSRFHDSRVDSWNDGNTIYTVHRKKKVIEMYDPRKGNADKYASKFKFTLDDFDYSMEYTRSNDILITLKQRPEAKGTVKMAKALLDKQTLAPKRVRIKLAMFWATIIVSDFKSGGIADDTFIFPRANYDNSYQYVDKRGN